MTTPAGPRAAGRRGRAGPPPRCRRCRPHLVRPDGAGLTMVNIGVGPANARRSPTTSPCCGRTPGSCSATAPGCATGSSATTCSRHGYVREDHVPDEDLPLWVPIPALAEVQVALESAGRDHATQGLHELKRDAHRHRRVDRQPQLGAAATARPGNGASARARAIALDMEKRDHRRQRFRFPRPHGTLLCVSDKPLHGEIKLPNSQRVLPRARRPAPAHRHARRHYLRGPASTSWHAMRSLPRWRSSSRADATTPGGADGRAPACRRRPGVRSGGCGGGRRMRDRPVRPRTERGCGLRNLRDDHEVLVRAAVELVDDTSRIRQRCPPS